MCKTIVLRCARAPGDEIEILSQCSISANPVANFVEWCMVPTFWV